jgi:hypothetical protein
MALPIERNSSSNCLQPMDSSLGSHSLHPQQHSSDHRVFMGRMAGFVAGNRAR